jgi:DNA-directed RNA polymerase I subunit RPA1
VTKVLVRATPSIEAANVLPAGKGKSLPSVMTSGVNFAALANLRREVDVNAVVSNDVYAVLKFYGVEAARATIVSEIKSVFGVYGIQVDPRHLGLIADYMTHEGAYKPLNRAGMESCSSPLLQMSFETTMKFLEKATMSGSADPLTTPSACIVAGQPPKVGTGAFEVHAQLPAAPGRKTGQTKKRI